MLRFLNLNLAFVILTVATAFGNYQVKESAIRAAKALKDTEAAIAEQELALRMLDAEWSYLNDPSRLQELAKPGQILLSDAVYQRARPHLKALLLPPVEIKGFAEQIAIYELLGLK